jgi:hypothetical protein
VINIRGKVLDLEGMIFGKLKVIGRVIDKSKKGTRWLCECECGNKDHIVIGSNLKRGTTTSCGCVNRKVNGLSLTKIYRVWTDMKIRCNNEKHKRYYDYGGRGIKVCIEWTDEQDGFLNFYDWSIKNGYIENTGLSIDRIDNDNNYEPDNCKWSTRVEQQNNTRANVSITINGVEKPISQWSTETGIDRTTLYHRYFHMNLRDDEILDYTVLKHPQSGEKGIYWKDKNKKWQVNLLINGKYTYVGIYEDLIIAVKEKYKYIENLMIG